MTNVRRPIHLQLVRPPQSCPNSASFIQQTSGSNHRQAPNSLIINNNNNEGTNNRINQQHHQQQQQTQQLNNNNNNNNCNNNAKQALSPTSADSMPSQILAHLFVGAQDQTSRETINRLNIKYILSLGLLPLVLQQQQQQQQMHYTHQNITSPTQQNNQQQYHQPMMPPRNCSRNFKIRIRSNTPSTTPTPTSSHSFDLINTVVVDNTTLIDGSTTTSTNGNGSITPTRQITTQTTTQTNNNRDENKGVKQVRSVYCKCINVADNADQLLSKIFEEAFCFIDEARRRKCNILIHCMAGISRSPTIAIAYLMRGKSMHWKEAYELVKQCRPQIDPNLSFMGQLRQYNKSLREQQQHQQQTQQSTHTNEQTQEENTKTPTTTTTGTTTAAATCEPLIVDVQ